MKSESGITTTSLIIYIIAMMMVIGIIATITSFFYNNVNNLGDSSKKTAQLTKFDMYFLEEVKKKDNTVANLNNNSILFLSGNIFTFQDNCIYFNKIVICKDVKNMQITEENLEGKNVINVLITLSGNIEYTRTMSYVMNSTM